MRLVRRALPESDSGPGLHDSEQIPDMQIAIEFSPFFIRQLPGLGPFRQLPHPVAVPLAEPD
jgi:hypothetical protein